MHELVQRNDGTLGVSLPETIEQSFQKALQLTPVARQGSLLSNDSMMTIDAEDGFGWAELAEMKETCLFRTRISWEEQTQAVGLMIHADSELRKWCQLRLELKHGRIVMDRYNRADGDQFYIDERPITFTGNSAEVKLIVSGNIMLVYVDDVALASRCYEIDTGSIGIFTEYGKMICTDSEFLIQ